MSPAKCAAILALASCIPHAIAGPASLTPAEVQQLRALVRADPNAAALFHPYQEAADKAVTQQPLPIENVISEGHLATDPRRIRTYVSLNDLPKIEALAWTWTVTGDPKYLEAERSFLTAWARVNKPDGDPINEVKFCPVCVAYDLTRDAMPPADRALVDAWLRGKAHGLMSKKQKDNNWGSNADVTVGLIGLTLQDGGAVAWAVKEFKHLVAVDLKPDGSTSDFHERDALHYQLYSVTPLLIFARAQARNGQNLFDYASPAGASLHRSVDFVRPFAEGARTHIEFAHSKVQFDRDRAKDREAEYIPHLWEPKAAIPMFSIASWFSAEYGQIATKLAGKTPYADWDMVLNFLHNPLPARQ